MFKFDEKYMNAVVNEIGMVREVVLKRQDVVKKNEEKDVKESEATMKVSVAGGVKVDIDN